ncbi:MAG: ABC transporter substrate-binding protein [Planctomycetes bacterium]|nr:ABC transporter substrate-binding protein [Planctomycetota bacterium]MCB9905554.1 ABC transporter substrate-binding protein [Planctomycetota bacterium]
MSHSVLRALALSLFLSPLAVSWQRTETTGVSDSRILLGQATSLKGVDDGPGRDMRDGLNFYFRQQNERGGIHGRTIELLTRNDAGMPKRCIAATRSLIDDEQVFMLIGQVGTPVARVAFPICEEAEVPYIAPSTGAEFLRKPHRSQVINLRASYFQEMERIAQYLVDEQGYSAIACFYQNDGYGQAGLEGIEKALHRRGMKLVSRGTYRRNTTDLLQGLAGVGAGSPEAVVLVGDARACAGFIRSAKNSMELSDAVFCNISSVDANSLHAALGRDGEGVIVSQVVPFPWDTSIPVVAEYQTALRAQGAADRQGFITLEGYLAAKFYCQVLECLEGVPTREAFMKAVVDIGTFDLGGVTLKFGPEDHQGMDEVFLTVFEGGEIKPLR